MSTIARACPARPAAGRSAHRGCGRRARPARRLCPGRRSCLVHSLRRWAPLPCRDPRQHDRDGPGQSRGGPRRRAGRPSRGRSPGRQRLRGEALPVACPCWPVSPRAPGTRLASLPWFAGLWCPWTN